MIFGTTLRVEPMAQSMCPYCGAEDMRCVVAGGGRFLTECRACERVVEERLSEVEELIIERAHDAPLCIVTPDFSENESYKAPPIEDDPFESIGFITAFSTWSLEQAPLFTATGVSFSGQLAEMERTLSDPGDCAGGALAAGFNGGTLSIADTLRAYFQIVDVASILGLERDSCDHAIQLFRDCLSSAAYLRNRNIEALAVAALVQAMREGQEPRTLQEISVAANMPQKEIGKHMKVLSDALKLSQPMNSNSISAHMPRFCNILQLSKTTQDLATHIGEVVLDKSFCTRRNPISVSAAAIYLACTLEDKRKTQTEICKATGLTEVTLRKVYKELLENLDDLLPPDYTPAVPLDKAFPGPAGTVLRVNGVRSANVGSMVDPLIPSAPYNSAMSNNSTGIAGDTSSAVGSTGATSPAQPNLARALASAGSLDRAQPGGVASYVGSSPLPDGRHGHPLFSLGHAGSGGGGVAGEAADRDKHDGAGDLERDHTDHNREQERERERTDTDFWGQKTVNMMSAASVPGFRPSFFPYAHVDPRIFQEMNPVMWSLPVPGAPAVKHEESAESNRGNGRKREDGIPNSKPSQQYVSFVPGMPDSLNPSMQMKMLPIVQGRTPEAPERQHSNTFERDRNSEKDREHARDTGETGTNSAPVLASNSAATLQAFAAAAAAAAASGRQVPPVFPGFQPGMWPFVSGGVPGPYGMFPSHLLQQQGAGLPQAHHGILSEKALENLPPGLLASAGVSAQAGGFGGQPNHLTLPWPGPPFHSLFLPATMSLGPGPAGGMSNGVNPADGISATQVDGAGRGMSIDGSVRLTTASGGGRNISPQPASDLYPVLGMGTGHGQPTPSGHPAATPRVDSGDVTTSVPMAKQPSFGGKQTVDLNESQTRRT